MKKVILFGLMSALAFTSCETEEDQQEKTIEGKWILESSVVLGASIPGDGSYLKFNGCSSECTGEDYKASNESKGLFTYELSDNESTLVIEDNESGGGSWNGTWQIIKFTDSELDIKMNSLFGDLIFEMKK